MAAVEALVAYPGHPQPLRHRLAFGAEQHRLRLYDEHLENADPDPAPGAPAFYYRYQQGQPVLTVAGGETRRLAGESVEDDASILAQRRDSEGYPEITYLATVYERIRIYREWAFGRNTIFREPQKADLRNDRLAEDFSNLGLFLNRLRRNPKAKSAILTALRDLYDGITDFDVSIEGGTVQVFLIEDDFVIPATRLSDGTLRYLCLLAILCDPEPPPLIAIEEPELGLHPDILPKVADLLMAAANPHATDYYNPFNDYIPRIDFGPTNPNTGQTHHDFVIGSENSRFVDLKLHKFYLHQWTIEDWQKLGNFLYLLGHELHADINRVMEEDAHNYVFTFWWD